MAGAGRTLGFIGREDLGGTNEAEWERLRLVLKSTRLEIRGKSTFKDEFVTAGGVSLAEVDFRTFESRLFPGLYFAGEVLDIDALTGGFNFQNAWTGAYHAARAMAAAESGGRAD